MENIREQLVRRCLRFARTVQWECSQTPLAPLHVRTARLELLPVELPVKLVQPRAHRAQGTHIPQPFNQVALTVPAPRSATRAKPPVRRVELGSTSVLERASIAARVTFGPATQLTTLPAPSAEKTRTRTPI